MIRHGHTSAIGHRLVGRTPGIHLTPAGHAQAARLVGRMRPHDLQAIYASPMERALETAQPLAADRALPVHVHEGLNEVEFGAWTGLTFDELATMPGWQRFTTHRSRAEVPGGECAADVQARIVGALEALRRAHPDSAVAVVSHADVIRAALLAHIGASLDMAHRIMIAPASLSTLVLSDAGALVRSLNEQDRA